MATRRLEGWLFDVDELGPEVALWVSTGEGLIVRLTEEFRPPVYVEGETKKIGQLQVQASRPLDYSEKPFPVFLVVNYNK